MNDRKGHERALERKRDAVAPCVLPGGMLLAVCLCADAAVPSLDITQFTHVPWKIGDGFTKGGVTSIVQTPDGYLWLVTEFGLARFDGGRPVPWRPPPRQHLPFTRVSGLLGRARFDQHLPPAMPGRPPYEHHVVKKWTAQITTSDGFVFVTPEYNYGPSAVLKNAIDWVYPEWNRKAAALVSYGGAMGARGVQQLRATAIELKMAYLRTYVCLLRKKIEKNPANPGYIVSEPWIGYRFRNPAGIAPRSV